MERKNLLSYHQRKQKKNKELFSSFLTGKSKFTKKSHHKGSAPSVPSTPTAATSAVETTAAATATSETTAATSAEAVAEQTVVILSPSPSQTTAAVTSGRKKRKTASDAEVIESDGKNSKNFETF